MSELSYHSPRCPIGKCSTVGGWCFEVDAARYQEESSATPFLGLNHDQTKADAMWVEVATLANLALDLNE